jgi:hypothetical protein
MIPKRTRTRRTVREASWAQVDYRYSGCHELACPLAVRAALDLRSECATTTIAG